MRTPKSALFLLAIAVAGTAACARDYLYRPTEQTGGVANGYPTARYTIPPEAPRGDVTISSRGVVSVRTQGDADDEKRRMLHLSLVASNDNDTGAWTIRTKEQRLTLPGPGERTPALATSSSGGAPEVTVPPGQRRTLDLYYALPEALNSDDELGKFELVWKVETPTRLVAERTPFEREQIETGGGYGYAMAPVTFGYGATWWYDPFYYPAYLYPPIIYYDTVGPYYYPGTPYYSGRDPAIAPPVGAPPSVSTSPNISAPAPAPSPPPAAPSVPSTPNISAPAR